MIIYLSLACGCRCALSSAVDEHWQLHTLDKCKLSYSVLLMYMYSLVGSLHIALHHCT